MQDSYNLYIIIINQSIEYQMAIATSAIKTGMNLNILLVKMAWPFCDCGKSFHK